MSDQANIDELLDGAWADGVFHEDLCVNCGTCLYPEVYPILRRGYEAGKTAFVDAIMAAEYCIPLVTPGRYVHDVPADVWVAVAAVDSRLREIVEACVDRHWPMRPSQDRLS